MTQLSKSILSKDFQYHSAASHSDPEAFRERMKQRALPAEHPVPAFTQDLAQVIKELELRT
jgi:hypothetical protein